MIKAIIFDASDVLYDHRGLNTKLFEMIEQRTKNYKIGMITNLPAHTLENHFSLEQLELFHYIHTYGKGGLSKPDPRVFTYTAEELGVETSECVYIDDMHVNVHAAEEAGMQTVLYKHFDYASEHLNELLSIRE